MVPPCSVKISRVPTYLFACLVPHNIFRIQGYHLLSPDFPDCSTKYYAKSCQTDPLSLAATNGISVDFCSSGYLDGSVPQVRFINLCIQLMISRKRDGLPHSEIPGSMLVVSSPRLIADYYVLHRLLLPRHPPYALNCLVIYLHNDYFNAT